MFNSIEQIREKHESSGGTFWAEILPTTFKNPRVSRTLYDGRFFVVSEKPINAERRQYYVYEATENGDISQAFDDAYPKRRAAKRAIRDIVSPKTD